jgi:hypothetical protein
MVSLQVSASRQQFEQRKRIQVGGESLAIAKRTKTRSTMQFKTAEEGEAALELPAPSCLAGQPLRFAAIGAP